MEAHRYLTSFSLLKTNATVFPKEIIDGVTKQTEILFGVLLPFQIPVSNEQSVVMDSVIRSLPSVLLSHGGSLPVWEILQILIMPRQQMSRLLYNN